MAYSSKLMGRESYMRAAEWLWTSGSMHSKSLWSCVLLYVLQPIYMIAAQLFLQPHRLIWIFIP